MQVKCHLIALNQCLFQIIASDNEDSSESETDIREQASFTEQLGSTSWCECVKCATVSSGIKCQCCREMESAVERIANNESY